MFKGKVGPNRDTRIMVDDLTLKDEACTWGTEVRCEFEDDSTCLWTNAESGLQWFASDGTSQHVLNGPVTVGEYVGEYWCWDVVVSCGQS